MKTNNKSIHNNTLRSIFSLSLVLLMFFFGCDQSSDPTSPLGESPDQQLKLKSDFPSSANENTRNPYLHREETYPPGADSIFVPLKLPGSEIPFLKKSKVIDGQLGGAINIVRNIEEGEDTIHIHARVNIPANAFNGSKEITMTLNNERGMISFYPHMVFNEPVIFNCRYRGIDLSDIDPNTVDFKFQNYSGTVENVESDSINVYTSSGTLEIIDAVLPHFSRYGFVN